MLAVGISGNVLKSQGAAAPIWSNPGGFIALFSGIPTAGQSLAADVPYALAASVTLNNILGSQQNVFVSPIAGIIVAVSAINSLSSSSATMSIHINSGTASFTTAVGQFTLTDGRVLTIPSTTTLVSAGDRIEVRINAAAVGTVSIRVYIA